MKKILIILSLVTIVQLNAMEHPKSFSPITPNRQEEAPKLSPTTVEQSTRKRLIEEEEEVVVEQEEHESASPLIKRRNRNEDIQEPSGESWRSSELKALLNGPEQDEEIPPLDHSMATPATPMNRHNNDINRSLAEAMRQINSIQLTLDEIKDHTRGLNTLANKIETLENLSGNASEMWNAVLNELAKRVSYFASNNPQEASAWILEELRDTRHATTDKLARAVQSGIEEQQNNLEQLQDTINTARWALESD